MIFVADVEHNYYVYVVPLSMESDQDPTTTAIAPIQKLTKHGQGQTIAFFEFEQDLYCLLGSTTIAEHRFVPAQFSN